MGLSDRTLLPIVVFTDDDRAYTVPKAEAFAAPLALLDVDAFFDGRNELSPYELMLAGAYMDLGRPDLADCVKGGRIYHRFAIMIGQPTSPVQVNALKELIGVGQEPQSE